MKTNSIMVVIERPDGTTYTQQVGIEGRETISDALNRLQRMLGEEYLICDFYKIEEQK